MRDFRFSCNVFAIRSAAAFADYCRAAERFGYDVIFTADHLGSPAPFATLVAAAAVTQRPRLGTMVLNGGFWNPHLLAREVATADLLTGGRLEIGLGAGHMKWEFDAAGLPWRPLPERADRLAATLDELERIFGSGGYQDGRASREYFDLPVLAPVQRRGLNGTGPPLIIGGTGDRMLTLAVRRADTVAVGGLFQCKGEPPGTFRMGTAAEADERVAFIRAQAGPRAGDPELHTLVQTVVLTDDRRAAARELVEKQMPYFTADELLETPFMLIGTVDEIVAQLRERRERYGFSFITVHEPYMTAFGQVIERLRASERAA
jgi:probable F420-dependent oxidoreductase